MRFSVESWAPEYGVAADVDQFDDASDRVDVTLERPLDVWAPITPTSLADEKRIMFVDGVRRIDARIWVHDSDRSYAGVCASVAAGAVTCDRATAVISDVTIGRFLIAPAAASASEVATTHARYEHVPIVTEDPNAVYLAIHGQMTALEQTLAGENSCDLIVFDGPLRGRKDPSGVGYVKTQHVQYLPEEARPVLAHLDDGQRTPLMLIGDRRGGLARWSWYLRLPGPRSQPLSGIVRCELPATTSVSEAITRADTVTRCLPRFASHPQKEPRAPQNLYPIAGLEQRLRHLLGDQLLLERALRMTASTSTPTASVN